MGSWTIDQKTFSVIRGNLAEETTDAVVLGVNEHGVPAGPATGAVFGAAGDGLEKHMKDFKSPAPGEAAVVPGFDLPASTIVLCTLRPHAEVDTPRAFLEECFRSALACAENEGFEVISLQPLGLGDFGYPVDVVSKAGIESITHGLKSSGTIHEVRVVVYDVVEYSSVDNFAKEHIEGPTEGKGNQPSLQF